MKQVRQLTLLLAIALMLLVLGGPGLASAQGPSQATSSTTATASCPPDFGFGCTVSGTGTIGLGINNTSTANNAAGVYATLRAPGTGAAAVWGRVLGNNSARGYGVYGSHQGSGIGVYGHSTLGTGFVGFTYSTRDASGVHGVHAGTAGTGAGVRGETNSGTYETAGVLGLATVGTAVTDTVGVRGHNNSSTASGMGVWGSHAGSGTGVYGNSATGTGVSGLHVAATGAGAGVQGQTNSGDQGAVGVLGLAAATRPANPTYGLRGINSSIYSTGAGVWGSHASDGTGVYGTSQWGNGVHGHARMVGVYGTSEVWGVKGESESIAVAGYSTNGYGLYGTSESSVGVYGRSNTDYGVVAVSTENNALRAISSGTTRSTIDARNTRSYTAIYGQITSTGYFTETVPTVYGAIHGNNLYTGPGVIGQSTGGWGVWGSAGKVGVYGSGYDGMNAFALGPQGSGIYARATDGWPHDSWAATFDGRVRIRGSLNVDGTKNFRIDHPLDPANQYLQHAAIESSEVLNLYTGNAVLDEKGEAVIELPAWFAAINRDFRYQLTPVGGFAPLYVASEVRDNHFTIAGGTPGLKVSWEVTALRSDPYMRDHPFEVEVEKPEFERGTYLYPAGYGQPESRSDQAAQEQVRDEEVSRMAAPQPAPEQPALEEPLLPQLPTPPQPAPESVTTDETRGIAPAPADTSAPPSRLPDGPATTPAPNQ